MKYCFGVDLGGTTVKMGLFQMDGELLDKWEILTRTENAGEAILPDIAESIKKKAEEQGIVQSDILGIGISLGARRDRVSKSILYAKKWRCVRKICKSSFPR